MSAPLERTIFAYGSGRSGTTLLAKLLDASPATLYRHEPDKVLLSPGLPFLPDPDEYERYREQASSYLAQLTQSACASVSCKRPLFPKEFRSKGGARLQSLLLPAFFAAERAGLRLTLPDAVSKGDFHYLIKSVSSVCRVPMFAAAAPGVKFIHIVRHPGAVIASLKRGIEQQLMSPRVFIREAAGMSNARAFDLPMDRLEELSFEEKASYCWMLENDKSERELGGTGNYLMVSYEDLCLHPDDRVQEICDFVGIPFVPQMRAFIREMTDGSDDDYFSVAKNPLSSIAKWEDQLPRETAERIVEIIEASAVGRFVLGRYADVKSQLPGALAKSKTPPSDTEGTPSVRWPSGAATRP